MRIFAPFAVCIAALVATEAPAEARQRSPFETGYRLLEGAFDPRRNFAGDIEPSSVDELILTIVASARDNYAPAYSLAIAHLCEPIEGGCRRDYVARLLRVATDQADWFGRSHAMLARVQGARHLEDVEAALDDSELQWLEADLRSCEGAFAAIDAVRRADWRPDLPPSLTPEGQGDLILHPAMIRVELWGAYIRTRYQGWLLGNGVPAAALQLMERLEPCWRPSRTPRPWERRVPSRRRPLP